VLRGRIGSGVGIDPDLGETYPEERIRYIRGRFPDDLAISERFDVITMLAVFEHFDDDTQRRAAAACGSLLRAGGRLILTVPEPAVDRIVHVLGRLRLVSGMAVHEHHGFEAALTPSRFDGTPLAIVRHERFQFGLNNLFVFRMP
jgi:2-polyprenyl-3-methyl-5-hydroxy-6-metoxy-1,4-benzoquinol methylase